VCSRSLVSRRTNAASLLPTLASVPATFLLRPFHAQAADAAAHPISHAHLRGGPCGRAMPLSALLSPIASIYRQQHKITGQQNPR